MLPAKKVDRASRPLKVEAEAAKKPVTSQPRRATLAECVAQNKKALLAERAAAKRKAEITARVEAEFAKETTA